MSSPKVFLSYSWDNESHKAWVAQLAADLRRDGVETRLDQWHTELGDQLQSFMAKEILENDFVIVVCTPNYRRKSDEGKGGVAYEGAIMTAEIAGRDNHRKFIPVIAQGTWEEAAPAWVKDKRYADLRTEHSYRANYKKLVNTLHGSGSNAPPLGRSPLEGEESGSGLEPDGTFHLVGSAAERTHGSAEADDEKTPCSDEVQPKPAMWRGYTAMEICTVAGLAIALLTLLYGDGVLRFSELDTQHKAQNVVDNEGTDQSKGLAEESSPHQPGTLFADCVGCPAMIVVSSGSFTLGSPQHEAGTYGNERPMRPVAISEPFAVGVYEVTRGEFGRFVEETGYSAEGGCFVLDERDWQWRISGEHDWRNVGFEQTDFHPVSCVNWNEAQEYVRWLSGRSGESYRLLSESEWEYVARGGTAGPRYWEDGMSGGNQCRFANGADTSTKFAWAADCNDGNEFTAPVGSYEPNAFGVHDVLGNVWEWVQDCWHDDYSVGPNDSSAWERTDCRRRVLRGGSRYVGPGGLRSAHRFKHEPYIRNQNTGFRVARSVSGEIERNVPGR